MATYTTSFPLTENPISEGGAWENLTGWNNVKTSGGYAISASGSGGARLVQKYQADQEVKVTISWFSYTGSLAHHIILRNNAATGTYYWATLMTTEAANNIVLYKWNGSSNTEIDRATGPSGSGNNGKVFEASVVGNTFTVKFDGTTYITANDSTYSGDQMGFAFSSYYVELLDFEATAEPLAYPAPAPVDPDNPRTDMNWLLELDVSGSTLRYATAEVDGSHYLGALDVTGVPSLSVDPYTGEASAASASLTLAPLPDGGKLRPLMRPCDIEDTFKMPLIGMVGRLYRYDGTTKELIVKGRIRDPKMDDKGNLDLTLIDFSEWYDNFRLPWYTITTDLWSAGDVDDVGRKAPICYGTFTGVEVPNIETANNRHIIGHYIGSATAGRVGDASSTPTDTNSTDSDGTEYCLLDYSTETTNKDTTVSGTGYLDDSDGTYTGTADALISNVADQLHHLAVEVVGIPSDDVDLGAFVGFRQSHLSHVNALIIGPDDDTSYFPLAAETLRPYRAACFVERGLLTIRKLALDAQPIKHLRDGEHLLSIDTVEWRGYEDTPGGLEFKYSRGWVTKKKQWDFRNVVKIKAADYPPFLAAYQQGSDLETIEAPHVQDADTAALLVDTVKELHSKTRRYVDVEVTTDCNSLKIFDTVQITSTRAPSNRGEGWAGKRFVVVGISYGLESSTLTLLEV